MTENKQSIEKKRSIDTLEKIIKLWKTKNNISYDSQSKFSTTTTTTSANRLRKSTDDSIMFLGRKLSRRQVIPNSIEDITLTAQKLCERYIESRFTRAGLKDFEINEDNISEEYAHVVQNMGQILELKYPRLYNKISAHLQLSYENEIVVWDTFNKVGSHLFTDGITWAKIIALYAFTGGLALDSMKHGKQDLPGRIVYWFGVFVMKKIATWIQSQGGWNAIVAHFNSREEERDEDEDTGFQQKHNENFLSEIKSKITRHPTRATILIIFLMVLFLSFLLSQR